MSKELETCPKCGGHADNGFSREIPPSPYYCRACMAEDRIEELEAERDELLALVIRYRKETPLGHQPHMIAHLADAAIAKVRKP